MNITILSPDGAAGREAVAAVVQAMQKANLQADVQLDTDPQKRAAHGSGTEPVVLVNGKALPIGCWQKPDELPALLQKAATTAATPAACASGCLGCPMATSEATNCCGEKVNDQSRKIVVAVLIVLLAAGAVFVVARGKGKNSSKRHTTSTAIEQNQTSMTGN